MIIEPTDWSIVIVGDWNEKIFSPGWVSKRLFEQERDESVEVTIPLEKTPIFRMKNPRTGVSIFLVGSSLHIIPQEFNLEKMALAVSVAKRVLSILNETPVRAAGINLKYTGSGGGGLTTKSFFDDRISESGFTISQRRSTLTLELTRGVVNVTLSEGNGEEDLDHLHLNFHYPERDGRKIIEWFENLLEQCEEVSKKVIDSLEFSMKEETEDE